MLKRLGARARFSVAFVTLKTRPVNNEEREIGQSRVITRARLLEASPVLLPAEPSTRLLELKSSAMEVAAALKERREIARVNAEWQRFMTQMANREADRLFKRFNRIRRTA
jgi:phage head maturation protease